MSTYEIDTVPADRLRKGDHIIQPVTDEELVIASKVSCGQWVTLKFTDGREVEVHYGDFIDRIVR